MTQTMSTIAAAYVQSVNDRDRPAFHALFADEAIVHDAGREFRGRAAIEKWSDHEVFDVEVTLEVLAVSEADGQTVITAQVDGSFDKTGLPNPLIIDQCLTIKNDKIIGLACRLAAPTVK